MKFFRIVLLAALSAAMLPLAGCQHSNAAALSQPWYVAPETAGESPTKVGVVKRLDLLTAYYRSTIHAAYIDDLTAKRDAAVQAGDAKLAAECEKLGASNQDIAHQHTSPEPQARLREVNQMVFEHVLLDLAYKLDVEEAPCCNVLDSSLVQWTQESGSVTHDALSLPLVTFGGAGGAISTGNYCDYVKRTDAGTVGAWGSSIGQSGLLYSQWLAQVLQAMGVERSEFQDIASNGAAGAKRATPKAQHQARKEEKRHPAGGGRRCSRQGVQKVSENLYQQACSNDGAVGHAPARKLPQTK